VQKSNKLTQNFVALYEIVKTTSMFAFKIENINVL